MTAVRSTDRGRPPGGVGGVLPVLQGGCRAQSTHCALRLLPDFPMKELVNNAVTMDMNNTGWNVDMTLVHKMQRRYVDNVNTAVKEFRATLRC